MRIIIGVTGASGVIIAKRLLEVLKDLGHETHFIVSDSGREVIKYELEGKDLSKLATVKYDSKDFAAAISSGSFKIDAMVVVPCSMKTLGAIANGVPHHLIARAADVCLKQERKLVLVPRETPLNLIHIENLIKAKRAGATIVPPMLSFYHEPKTIDDLIDHTVGKVLDMLGIDNEIYKRWGDKK
jgi:flavin prenyltransferase